MAAVPLCLINLPVDISTTITPDLPTMFTLVHYSPADQQQQSEILKLGQVKVKQYYEYCNIKRKQKTNHKLIQYI